jgi:two-component system, OmpR family, phosphate regulon response regulator PhoB
MAGKTVLVVEDDHDIRDMLVFSLEKAGFAVVDVEDAETAMNKLESILPDIMLVDWMLPGMDGPEFVRRVRKDELTQLIPVIMLTARGDETDKIRGLENGADDYVTKPFSPKELMARMKALLRRSGNSADEVLKINELSLDTQAHRLTIKNESVDIGPTEYKLLEFFLLHQDRVYSREQLLDLVWGRNVYVEERTVDVHVLRLRKLLSPYSYEKLLQTVRGAGYRFSSK